MNKKLLIAGGAVVALLIILAVAVNLGDNKKDKTNTNSTSTSQAPVTKENKKLDTEKTQNLQAMLKDFVLNATASQQTYPKSNTDGWMQFRYIVDNVDYFKDPFTGNTYKYVSDKVTPDYDEIQYAPGYTCDKNGKDFTPGNIRYVALRSRFSTGIKCISSVQIQATDADSSGVSQ